MKTFLFVQILSTVIIGNVYSQNFDSDEERLKSAVISLRNKDTTQAISILSQSVGEENSPGAYFLLAKIYSNSNQADELNIANRYIEKAIVLEPNNVNFLLTEAHIKEEIFYRIRDAFFSRGQAVNSYEKILEIDSNNTEALYNLGRLKSEDYQEFKSSVLKFEKNVAFNPIQKFKASRDSSILKKEKYNEFINTPGNYATISFNNFAMEDFYQAESYLQRALAREIHKNKIIFELLKLYYLNHYYDKGIDLIKNIGDGSTAKNVYLLAGLIYNAKKDYMNAFSVFNKAIKYMNEGERNDLLYNSVFVFLKSSDSDNLSNKSKEALAQLIQEYWKCSDPLLMTPYSERMIEHYARVAYANVFLGSRRISLTGWKSDRGETVIRYGIPDKIERLRRNPEVSPGPQAEIWYYDDYIFSFSDPMLNEEYSFAVDYGSQVPINSYEEMVNLRQTKPEIYNPVFQGPVFDVSYQLYQFASTKRLKTDIYLAYGVSFENSGSTKENFSYGYDAGFFLLDNSFNKLERSKISITKIDTSSALVNTLTIKSYPLSGNFAFEMIRKKDFGVASYHGKKEIKYFSFDSLTISDLLLASNIVTNQHLSGCIERDGISILPNPFKHFSNKDPLFLYYEVYNLAMDANKLTDFDQEVTIRKIEDESGLGEILNKVGEVLGMGKEGEKITLTSHYKTLERNPQIYFQMDLGKYESGDYEIEISIIDKVTMKRTKNGARINWAND